MHAAVALYPAFSGVRQQLRREIGGLKKLFEAQDKKRKEKDADGKPGQPRSWPGPDPEALPVMIGFRAQNEGAKK